MQVINFSHFMKHNVIISPRATLLILNNPTMKILSTLVAFCISTCCFSQKGDYLVKNNGDTVWGDISLKKSVFYITGITNTEINAEDVTKIKSSRYNGNTVLPCTLQLYTDDLASLELDYISKGKID